MGKQTWTEDRMSGTSRAATDDARAFVSGPFNSPDGRLYSWQVYRKRDDQSRWLIGLGFCKTRRAAKREASIVMKGVRDRPTMATTKEDGR